MAADIDLFVYQVLLNISEYVYWVGPHKGGSSGVLYEDTILV